MLFTSFSPAERTVLTAYFGLSATGALLGFDALEELQAMDELVGVTAGNWLSTILAASGALLAAIILRESFGRPGLLGAGQAFVSSCVATCLMGIIAGTFLLPVFGTMFGPWLIITTLIVKPWLALPWALALFGFHLARSEYDRERETIFRYVPKIDAT